MLYTLDTKATTTNRNNIMSNWPHEKRDTKIKFRSKLARRTSPEQGCKSTSSIVGYNNMNFNRVGREEVYHQSGVTPKGFSRAIIGNRISNIWLSNTSKIECVAYESYLHRYLHECKSYQTSESKTKILKSVLWKLKDIWELQNNIFQKIDTNIDISEINKSKTIANHRTFIEAVIENSKKKKDSSNTNQQSATRDKAVRELLETEVTYVDKLRGLNDIYCKLLLLTQKYPKVSISSRNSHQSLFGAFNSRSMINSKFEKKKNRKRQTNGAIDRDDLRKIFMNIAVIYKLHSEHILPRLRAKKLHSNLGSMLKRIVPMLKLYGEYINNFDNSQKVTLKYDDFWQNLDSRAVPNINECHSSVAKNVGIIGTLKKKASRPFLPKPSVSSAPTSIDGVKNLFDINSLLILPVQRIPRYKLLLETILKNTDHLDKDFNDLADVLLSVSLIANDMNESKRRQDLMVQYGSLITKNSVIPANLRFNANRVFIKKGDLTLVKFLCYNDVCTKTGGTSEDIPCHSNLFTLDCNIQASSDLDSLLLNNSISSTLDYHYPNVTVTLLLFNDFLLLCSDNCHTIDAMFLLSSTAQASSVILDYYTDSTLLRIIDRNFVLYFAGPINDLNLWNSSINSRLSPEL
ncbi:FYVE, RhoGEF and PH domain-containing protein 3 [Zancudomyces culisetae]|uniref:FYVE, RhoGEF and PH domain-containing protein 3 n=1 Tax=Zancudomyces culisetae TaxID=1213189 RepID=A0A1R1PPP8_ZANCU|nr:FYVE, RhoGEF and PH domain-containing protein 3 [Zancudomyces culisetae]|eukprot:OMH82955.1 FYVE, RhoGEF and PH domain-containing protein 3 [Zancudomyces culisetae]